jgi:SAM-dependent methyltransferase
VITPSGFAKKMLLKKALFLLPKPEVLIDAGCSGATLSADLNAEVKIAMDLSLNLNPRVRKKVQGVTSDLNFIPLRSNSIDCVLCLDVIEHIKNDTELLEQFQRILKSGGFLILTTPMPNEEYMPVRLLRAMLKLERKVLDEEYGHVRPGYTFDDIKRLLENHSFKIIYYSAFNGPLTRLLDLLIYRPIFKFYNRGQPFVETYAKRTEAKRGHIINFLENVHDTFFPFTFGPFIKIFECICKGSKVEHFIVCQKFSSSQMS